MKIWKTVQENWSKLFSSKNSSEADATEPTTTEAEKSEVTVNDVLDKTKLDISTVLDDPKLSAESKQRLLEDKRQLERLIEKLENKQFHIAVFGRVSVGKSSLLNALIGKNHFSTSVLHGETKTTTDIFWRSFEDHGLVFVDTPGIDELQGEEREAIARQAVNAADMILFVIDSDLTQLEFEALSELYASNQPIIVVVNKEDRLSSIEKTQLHDSITDKLNKISKHIPLVFVSADPRPKDIIKVDEAGNETVTSITPVKQTEPLKEAIWHSIQASGKTLQVMNAAIFASQLNNKLGEEIINLRAEVAQALIKKYCLGKALAVGLNPIPLLDIAVVFGDVAMIKHLASVYGFEITKQEASRLLKSILTELSLVLGASYGIQALSSILKGLSAGLSTVLTASSQGLAAWYGTYLVGKASEEYFKRGANWGEQGANTILKKMLEDIDKTEVLEEAKTSIQSILKK